MSPGPRRRRLGAAPVLLVAASVAGCAAVGHPAAPEGSPPTTTASAPLSTARIFFTALNGHDRSAVVAAVAPAARSQVQWSFWPPPFRHLRCHLTSATAAPRRAGVECDFDEIYSPGAGMSNTTFWNLELRRYPSGRWLITGYGQG